MTTTHTIPAAHVVEGMFFPGLDNGYVFMDPEPWDGNPDHFVEISFHDAQGDECYLIVPKDSYLTVEATNYDPRDYDTDDDDESLDTP